VLDHKGCSCWSLRFSHQQPRSSPQENSQTCNFFLIPYAQPDLFLNLTPRLSTDPTDLLVTTPTKETEQSLSQSSARIPITMPKVSSSDMPAVASYHGNGLSFVGSLVAVSDHRCYRNSPVVIVEREHVKPLLVPWRFVTIHPSLARREDRRRSRCSSVQRIRQKEIIPLTYGNPRELMTQT
jgi:hypothetical protein